MRVAIIRKKEPSETRGIAFVIDNLSVLYKFFTLELADNGNQRNVSCIPEGSYNCEKMTRPGKSDCFHVLDVPGRSDILIHSGNFRRDTKGCILPGAGFMDIDGDKIPDVYETVTTMTKLMTILPNKFLLTII